MRKQLGRQLWALTAVVLPMLMLLGLNWYSAKLKLDQLKQNVHLIQVAVEIYASQHQGVYPESLTAVIGPGPAPGTPRLSMSQLMQHVQATGTLPGMPDNPYAPGPLPVLAAGDSPFDGGVVYIPISAPARLPDAVAAGAPPPPPPHNYLLVGYGPWHKVREEGNGVDWRKRDYERQAQTAAANGLSMLHTGYAEYLALDWERVVILLDKGCSNFKRAEER